MQPLSFPVVSTFTWYKECIISENLLLTYCVTGLGRQASGLNMDGERNKGLVYPVPVFKIIIKRRQKQNTQSGPTETFSLSPPPPFNTR